MKINTQHFSFIQLQLPNVRPGQDKREVHIAGEKCLVGGSSSSSKPFSFPPPSLTCCRHGCHCGLLTRCCCWLLPYCFVWGEVNEEPLVFKLRLLIPIFLELLCLTYMIFKRTVYKLNLNLSSLRKVFFSFLVPNLILTFKSSWSFLLLFN